MYVAARLGCGLMLSSAVVLDCWTDENILDPHGLQPHRTPATAEAPWGGDGIRKERWSRTRMRNEE